LTGGRKARSLRRMTVSRKIRPVLWGLALGVLAGAAAAQGVTDTMRAMLDGLPGTAEPLRGTDDLQVEFGHPGPMASVLSAHLAAGGDLPLSPEASRLTRALPSFMRDSGALTDPEGLAAATGLAPDDIGPMVTLSQPPARLVVMAVAPGAAERMVAALTAGGHAAEVQGPVTRLSRGADYAVDFALRDTSNPFGGALGQSARFAVAEGVIAWAPATALIEALLTRQPPTLAAHPALAAMLSGLDAAAGDAGGLVHALALVDGPGPDVLVADLARDGDETGVLVLTAPDAAAAAALADRLQRNWTDRPLLAANDRPLAAVMPGPVTITAHAGQAAAVTLRLTRPRAAADPIWRNGPADLLLRLVMQNEIAALTAP
jgi:hypothetical protein